ncbi:hypothetical protein GCM10009558_105140 [Virgisporangium aurantiacum]
MSRLPVADRATVRRAALALVALDRRAITVVLALHGAAAVAALAVPWLVGEIVDDVVGGAGASTVDRLALAIVGCVLAQGLLTRYAQYTGYRFGERAIARLRERFVTRTLALPVSVVERVGVGDLATRSSVDVATVGTTVRDVLPVVFLSVVRLILLLVAVFLLHPVLGLASLVGVLPISLATRWYLRRASSAYIAEGAALADLTDTLTTTAEGARTVEALRLTDDRIRHGHTSIGRLWARRRVTLGLRTRYFPIVEGSYAPPIAAVLVVGGFLLHRDAVRPLTFVADYARVLLPPLLRLATRHGIGLEAHLQNCLPVLRGATPVRMVLRDVAGLRIHLPRLAARGHRPPLWPGSVVGTDDVTVMLSKLGYTALQAHLGELIRHLADTAGLDETAAWHEVRRVVDEVYDELRRDPAVAADAAADHAFWTAPRMPHKALVRMRLAGAGDVYVPVPNPLATP